jgi:GNAT superfamily N-acetyltransferase
MSVTIRDATPGDAELLTPLLEALGYPVDAETIRGRLIALFESDPSGRVLVAISDARIIGLVTVHVTPVLHRPTGIGRITALAVLESARGTGAGRALVEACESLCRQQGLGRIEVTSGLAHTAAYEFYRHLGYEDHGLRFAKPLG